MRRPFSALVQVTNRCNLTCGFCDFWPHPAPEGGELDPAEFRRVAAEMAEVGCFLVSIEGGEPLVRADIASVVGAFAERHVTALFTNGWYVTDASARALFDAGLVHAAVSIDFADAARHDARRGAAGATERAWAAVEHLKAAAPNGGAQVNVITVLMKENVGELPALLELSAAHGVGHYVTLVSRSGFRRGKDVELPDAAAGALLDDLWMRHRHLRLFRDYVRGVAPFLAGGALPACRAGIQAFNLDHVGNVAPCIEKIDRPVGNVRSETLTALLARMAADRRDVEGCQDCWTLCRGTGQVMGGGGTLSGWIDLATRLRPA